jgi:hypothetical protein
MRKQPHRRHTNGKKTVEILTDKQVKQGKGEVVPLVN